jgi:hypothetical protein
MEATRFTETSVLIRPKLRHIAKDGVLKPCNTDVEEKL